MRRLLVIPIILSLVLIPLVWEGVHAAVPSEEDSENAYFNLPLCLPGMPVHGSCMMYGPAQTVIKMEADGFPSVSYTHLTLPTN